MYCITMHSVAVCVHGSSSDTQRQPWTCFVVFPLLNVCNVSFPPATYGPSFSLVYFQTLPIYPKFLPDMENKMAGNRNLFFNIYDNNRFFIFKWLTNTIKCDYMEKYTLIVMPYNVLMVSNLMLTFKKCHESVQLFS